MKHNLKPNRNQLLPAAIIVGAFLLSLVLAGCRQDSSSETGMKSAAASEKLRRDRQPPSVTLFLVPMDGMKASEMEQLARNFKKNFGERQPEKFEVEILPHMMSPDSCLNDAKTRLRADKLMHMLNGKYSAQCRKKADEKDPGNAEYHVMGVTNRDISTTVHGKADYGILGLSYLRGPHTGVVSNYRLRQKKDLWKLTAHEFCHGFYHCPHCKNDDPHCLMADAKGGNPRFEIKDTLCRDCAKICSPSGRDRGDSKGQRR